MKSQEKEPAGSEFLRARTLRRRAPKAAELLAHELVIDIVAGGSVVGQRLPLEGQMVEKYEVSRSTVREALRILEVNGLVSIRPGPNGGPTFREATPGDLGRMLSLYFEAKGITVKELLEARCDFETLMVVDAARNQDPEFIAKCEALLKLDASVDTDNDEQYVGVTRQFHELVASAAKNRVFSVLGLGLLSMFVSTLDRAVYPPSQRKRVLGEHDAILRAILQKDGASAMQLMSDHMREMRASIASRQPQAYEGPIKWL